MERAHARVRVWMRARNHATFPNDIRAVSYISITKPSETASNESFLTCCEHFSQLCDRAREEAGVFKVREFVYICCAHPPKLRQSARRKPQNFANSNNSKLIFGIELHLPIQMPWTVCAQRRRRVPADSVRRRGQDQEDHSEEPRPPVHREGAGDCEKALPAALPRGSGTLFSVVMRFQGIGHRFVAFK